MPSRDDDRSILQRYPVEFLYISAVVLAVVGFILMMTVVGTIAGLPLLALAAVLGVAGYSKSRARRTSTQI